MTIYSTQYYKSKYRAFHFNIKLIISSKDGILYNLHDETLDRTTNGKGLIGEATAENIDQFDAGSWFNGSYARTKMPRIYEMLDSLKEKANVLFDVKQGIDIAII